MWPNGAAARGLHLHLSGDGQADVTDTDEDGRYEFRLRRSDDHGLFHAYISGDAGDGSLYIRAESQGPDIAVPTVVVWAPTLHPTQDARAGLLVSWPEVGSDVSSSYEVVLLHDFSLAWWSADAHTDTTIQLPAEVLEDHVASVVVTATTGFCPLFEYILPRPGAAPGAGACIIQTSPHAKLPAGSAVPISRGAICATRTDGVEEPLLTQGQPPCPLTDGLAATVMYECPAAGCPQEVTLDLGESKTVSSVVVHGGHVQDGVSRAVVVETSTDGQAYDPAVSFEPDDYDLYAQVPLESPRSARFVRLRAEDGMFAGLGDVALF